MNNDEYPSQLAMLINGEWHGKDGRETQPVINPATEEMLAELPHASVDDLDHALAAAQRGFVAWSALSAWARADIMQRAAQIVADRKAGIAAILTMENGKPLADSIGELDRVIETITWCAEEGKRTYGRVMPPRAPG